MHIYIYLYSMKHKKDRPLHTDICNFFPDTVWSDYGQVFSQGDSQASRCQSQIKQTNKNLRKKIMKILLRQKIIDLQKVKKSEHLQTPKKYANRNSVAILSTGKELSNKGYQFFFFS